jgi:hypothetical protein
LQQCRLLLPPPRLLRPLQPTPIPSKHSAPRFCRDILYYKIYIIVKFIFNQLYSCTCYRLCFLSELNLESDDDEDTKKLMAEKVSSQYRYSLGFYFYVYFRLNLNTSFFLFYFYYYFRHRCTFLKSVNMLSSLKASFLYYFIFVW